MEDEPERGGSSSSSPEAGTSSAVHGGRFPSHDQFHNRELEERQQQRQTGDFRGSGDAVSSAGGNETWSCVIVLATFWLFVSLTMILGVYGTITLRLSPNCSILLNPTSIFVQSIKIEDQSKSMLGPMLYGLYTTPSLDAVKLWTETHNVSISTDYYKDLMYYLNEGSRINISYTVDSPSSSIFLVIAQGDSGLSRWLENPSYPNTTLSWNIIHGSGMIWQDILFSSSYYVAVGNLNSESMQVQLNVTIKSTMYNTTEAYYKCNLTQGSCSMSVFFPEGNAAVVTALGSEQALSEHELYVKLSYGPRWVTYVVGIAGMTVLTLFVLNFLTKFQQNSGETSGPREQMGSNRVPLMSHKDDDLSSYGSSYDSLSHDEEDLENLLAAGSLEGTPIGEGENSNNTRRLCAICFDAPRDCFFLPCGHCVACFACGMRIAEADGICPICRRKMKKVRKIFTV